MQWHNVRVEVENTSAAEVLTAILSGAKVGDVMVRQNDRGLVATGEADTRHPGPLAEGILKAIKAQITDPGEAYVRVYPAPALPIASIRLTKGGTFEVVKG